MGRRVPEDLGRQQFFVSHRKLSISFKGMTIYISVNLSRAKCNVLHIYRVKTVHRSFQLRSAIDSSMRSMPLTLQQLLGPPMKMLRVIVEKLFEPICHKRERMVICQWLNHPHIQVK